MIRPPGQLGAQFGAATMNANLPASTLTRPGANASAPNVSTRVTDVSSGSTPQAPGYGGYRLPGETPLQRIMRLPGVMAAQNAYNTQGAIAGSNYRTGLMDQAVAFGDPTAFGNVLGLPSGGQAAPFNPSPTNFQSDAASGGGYGPGQAAPSAWSSFLGSLDPTGTVGAAARAATIGPGGSIGNSVVAQWHLATQEALRQAAAQGLGGFQGSGQVGHNLNLANIAQGQDLYNKYMAFMGGVHQLGSDYTGAMSKLASGVQNAIASGQNLVATHPGLYPILGPRAAQVGSTVPSPWGAGQGPFQMAPLYTGGYQGGPWAYGGQRYP